LSAAQAEKEINLIALPDNWANYGTQSMKNTVIGDFYANYKITCNSVAPNDSSAQELAAIKADKGTSKEPDVVDVSPAIAVLGESYFQPYKVQTWSDIPNSMKDPAGRWYGDYYGVISFGTNTSVVKNPPKSWADLQKPEYQGQVAIDGNPGSAGDAFAAVFSAALAMGGSLDNIMPGLEYFQHLKNIGNFIPVDCYPANIVSGSTPIAIVWDYLNLPQAVPEHQIHGEHPDHGALRRLLLPGDQQVRAAPEGGRALAGIRLLRRGPAGIPGRIRPPGAVLGHGSQGQDPCEPRKAAAPGEPVHKRPLPNRQADLQGERDRRRELGLNGGRLLDSQTAAIQEA
jgi:hypothetical protein